MPSGAGRPWLRTLGGLSLDGVTPSRPKPLLVAAYLALEGRQPRRRVAELLFGGAERPPAALSVALTRLRSVVGDALEADARTLSLGIPVDTTTLLRALERGDLVDAERAYAGSFLEGVSLGGASAEFEEWVYETREFIAEQLRLARLEAAERALRGGDLVGAGDTAERAMLTPGCAAADPELLERAYRVLARAGRTLARRVEVELRAWGVDAPRVEVVTPPRSEPAVARAQPPRSAVVSDMVGREAELQRLTTALGAPEQRVVTLVGPGGIGKTTLARHTARVLGERGPFRDGVYQVSLVDVADDARVADRVAQVLGVTLSAREAAEPRLARALAGRHVLIVLDDAERLVAGVRALLDACREAPTVRWLVTSREPLAARDEHVVALGGLAVPPDCQLTPDELAHVESVALYLRRRRRWATSPPVGAAWNALAQLCRDLGGWPLALEIAASLERVVPLADLIVEVRRDLSVLEHPEHPEHGRQHSVTRILDASWERLEPRDRRAAEHLSGFHAPFTRDAAHAVADVGVSTLVRLLERSLVRQRDAGRFDLHPLVRQYAITRLERAGAAEGLRRRHAEHVTAHLAGHGDALAGPDGVAVAATLARSHGDLRSAWVWAIERGEDAWWQRCVAAFGRYLEASGRYRDGAALLALAAARVERVGAAAETRAEVALAHGTLLARAARFEEAERALRPALAGANAELVAQAHETLGGQVFPWLGAYDVAAHHLRAASDHYRARADAAGAARCAFQTAAVAYALGDLHAAEAALHEALETFETRGDEHWALLARAALAVVWFDGGEADRAERALRDARDAARTRASEHARAMIDSNLALVRHALGTVTRADRAALDAALDTFERLGDDPWVAEAGALAARLHAAAGDRETALTALRRALAAGLRHPRSPQLAYPVAAAADLFEGRAPPAAIALHGVVAGSAATPALLRKASRAVIARLSGSAGGTAPAAAAADDDAERALRSAAQGLFEHGVAPGGGSLEEALRG